MADGKGTLEVEPGDSPEVAQLKTALRDAADAKRKADARAAKMRAKETAARKALAAAQRRDAAKRALGLLRSIEIERQKGDAEGAYAPPARVPVLAVMMERDAEATRSLFELVGVPIDEAGGANE